jgi:hypothetical protein
VPVDDARFLLFAREAVPPGEVLPHGLPDQLRAVAPNPVQPRQRRSGRDAIVPVSWFLEELWAGRVIGGDTP